MSVIETERLLLRPLTDNDAAEMFKNWTCDERVAGYCRWHPHGSVQETKELLKMYKNQAEKGFDFRWGIELKSNGELIGIIDVVNLSENKKTAKIGYNLAYDYWNNGYATEALNRVINNLFKNGMDRIIGKHHIDNHASGRVMEKCGMRFVGLSKTQAKLGSDEECDVKCYELKFNCKGEKK